MGFMFRNHLGVDFAGTNTAREGYDLPPLLIGETCTVDFYLDLPALYASLFSFSPAVADGTLNHYSTCDWIDNAIVLPMEVGDDPIYGQIHFPCRVQVNTKLGSGTDRFRRRDGIHGRTGDPRPDQRRFVGGTFRAVRLCRSIRIRAQGAGCRLRNGLWSQ